MPAREIVEAALKTAGEISVYSNQNVTVETL
jgi:ATP-dependent protease HslVU (ClpYQ) peptidase subunit